MRTSAIIFAVTAWPVFGAAQSLGTYGTVGLIDMPTATMRGDGAVGVTIADAGNASKVTLSFQLSPKVEASYRYATIFDFGSPGTQSDSAQFGLKVQLLDETDLRPSLALGFRDLAGSAEFSSEYLVATKRFDNGFSVTGGLGWGRMASRSAGENPFGGTRPNAPGGIDQFNANNAFKGADIGVFGGIEYASGDWRLKAEYSSDAYDQEVGGGLNIDSPWNFGIERTFLDVLDVGAYLIGGNNLGLRVSFQADPMSPRAPQDLFPGPAPFSARAADAKRGINWAQNPELKAKMIAGISEVLAAEGIIVESAKLTAHDAEFQITNTKMTRQPKAIGRTARVMAVGMPPSVDRFRITLVEAGLPVSTSVIERRDMETLVDTFEAVPESWKRLAIQNARTLTDPDYVRVEDNKFDYSITPTLPFGLYDGGLDFDIQLEGYASYQINPSLSISGLVTQTLLGGQGGDAPAPGALPQVRSNAISYSKNTPVLQSLTADYITQLGDGLYGRASLGYLESMFGGVSGEILYKDVNAPLAYGLELNYARQRDPDDQLGFLDYDVVSGHGSLYWDTGWNGVNAQLDAGRYLAGDWGATMTLSRRFNNGWEVAGFATATDADLTGSFSRFDKGVRLTVPLQWSLPFATRNTMEIPFQDYTRDDGARLAVDSRLYDTLRNADRSALRSNWGAFWQ